MPKQTLTESFVRRVEPTPGKQVVIFDQHRDGRGLVLTVNPGGSKTWSALYYDAGISRYYKLGRYPILTLAEARMKARKFLADPAAQLARDAEAARTAKLKPAARVAAEAVVNGGHYFGDVAEAYLARHVRAKGLRSANEVERIIRRYVLDDWQDLIVTTIRRSPVTALLDHIEDSRGRATANAVLKVLSSLFRWYADNLGDDDYSSPINSRQRRGDPVKRDRVLDDDELRAVWNASGDAIGFPAIVKLCLLTAQRSRKISTMKWTDIVDGTWKISAEKREKGNAGVLILPPVAVQIIERQPRLPGNPFVFTSRRSRAGHFTNWGEGKEALDEKLPPMPHWTIHDLRRTARTLMARAKVGEHIAEAALGHTLGGVAGIYQRYPFTQEKGRALDRLAKLIGKLVDAPPDNVVPLRAQAQAWGEAQRA